MASPDDITLFTTVDRTSEPDFFKRFLDEGNKLPDIIASKLIIIAGLKLTGGEKCSMLGAGLATTPLSWPDWWEAMGACSALISEKA